MKRKHRGLMLVAFLLLLGAGLLLLHVFLQLTTRPANQSEPEGMSQATVNRVWADVTLPAPVELSGSDTTGAYTQVTKVQVSSSGEFQPVAASQGKDSLDEEPLLNLYEQLEKQVYQVSEMPDDQGHYCTGRVVLRKVSLTEAQVVRVITAFLHDHPQVFWLDSRYGYASGDHGTVVQMYSVLPASECSSLSQKLSQELEKILASAAGKTRPIERERALYDALISRCQYDTQAACDDGDWRAHSMVGAVLDGEAVCEGYSRTLQYLLNQSGIPSMLVMGSAGGAHMWNLVRVDGQWYHVDVTWDDGGESMDEPIHKYFNLTDSMIRQDHTPSPEMKEGTELEAGKLYNLPLPSCSSEKANYFRVYAKEITNDSDLLTDVLVKAAADKKKVISLRVGENLSYSDTVAKLFLDVPFLFENSVNSANLHEGVSIRFVGCTYIEAPASRGIVIVLDYE